MIVPVAGAELELLPERAAYWRERRTLFVADTHWGKAATLRAHSIPVPAGTTTDDMSRLSSAVERSGCQRLVLLGDAIHAREGQAPKTLQAVADWRARHPNLEILLVRGNHDRGAGDPPANLDIKCVNAPVLEAPFVFQHYAKQSPNGFVLAGHTHPAIKLYGRAMQRATLRCFWFTESTLTLPAFGSFCGSALIEPAPGDSVFVIAEGEIIKVC